MRETKINQCGHLDGKDIIDNKKFWKTFKPLLPDKSINSDQFHLNENGEITNSESKTAKVLNNFFLDIEKLKNSRV